MVRLGRHRWNERMCSGEVRNTEDYFVCVGMAQVSRERALQDRRMDGRWMVFAPHRHRGAHHTIVPRSVPPLEKAYLDRVRCSPGLRLSLPSCGSGPGHGLRQHRSAGEWGLELVQHYREPMIRAMSLRSKLRGFGGRPRDLGHDWIAHIPREANR